MLITRGAVEARCSGHKRGSTRKALMHSGGGVRSGRDRGAGKNGHTRGVVVQGRTVKGASEGGRKAGGGVGSNGTEQCRGIKTGGGGYRGAACKGVRKGLARRGYRQCAGCVVAQARWCGSAKGHRCWVQCAGGMSPWLVVQCGYPPHGRAARQGLPVAAGVPRTARGTAGCRTAQGLTARRQRTAQATCTHTHTHAQAHTPRLRRAAGRRQ